MQNSKRGLPHLDFHPRWSKMKSKVKGRVGNSETFIGRGKKGEKIEKGGWGRRDTHLWRLGQSSSAGVWDFDFPPGLHLCECLFCDSDQRTALRIIRGRQSNITSSDDQRIKHASKYTNTHQHTHKNTHIHKLRSLLSADCIYGLHCCGCHRYWCLIFFMKPSQTHGTSQ